MLAFLPLIATILAFSHHTTNVVLITLDGVRWQEVFNGTDANRYTKNISAEALLPNIYKYFVRKGMVYGKLSDVITSEQVSISKPGYAEMMRGHPTNDCFTNTCNAVIKNTIIDYFYNHHNNNIAVFSSWNTIRQVVGSHANSIKLSAGKEQGVFYKHSLGENSYRPDEYTAAVALKYYKDYWPEFLWVSLGNTDEYGHMNDYNKYIESLKLADDFIGNLIDNLYPNTTVILTTDHGRSKNFRDHYKSKEAQKIWLMLYGRKVEPFGFVKWSETLSLSNIYPTIIDIVFDKYSKNSLLGDQ